MLRARIDFLEQMLAHFEAKLPGKTAPYEAAMSLLPIRRRPCGGWEGMTRKSE